MSLINIQRTLLLPSRQKPYIASWTRGGSASSPITITLPNDREKGALGLLWVSKFGGTNAPGIPSGWSGSGGVAASASLPGWRFMYRRMDGSEAPTTTSSATGTTSMSYICMMIESDDKVKVPVTTGTSSGTSAAPDAAAPAPTAPFGNMLWLTYYMTREAAHTVDGRPIGFCLNEITQRNNSTTISVIGQRRAIGSIDPSAWTLSASVDWRAAAAAIY